MVTDRRDLYKTKPKRRWMVFINENDRRVSNLRLCQAVLPNSDKRRDAILSVVKQYDPVL